MTVLGLQKLKYEEISRSYLKMKHQSYAELHIVDMLGIIDTY